MISANSDILCSGFPVTANLVNSDLNMKCSSGMPAKVSNKCQRQKFMEDIQCIKFDSQIVTETRICQKEIKNKQL